MNILPGLTTISNVRDDGGSHWREKISEIDKLGLKEIALFPTGLSSEKEREDFYKLLSKTGLENIPHVHIRDDMKEWELDHLVEKYNTKVFNTHPWPLAIDFLKKTKHSKNIFIENLHIIDEVFLKALELSGGLCVDFSHYEDWGRRYVLKGYENFPELMKKNKIGCCHISAILDYPQKKIKDGHEYAFYNSHVTESLSDFDYMKDHIKYLPEIVSIELENSLEEQLRVKKYLEEMIKRS